MGRVVMIGGLDVGGEFGNAQGHPLVIRRRIGANRPDVARPVIAFRPYLPTAVRQKRRPMSILSGTAWVVVHFFVVVSMTGVWPKPAGTVLTVGCLGAGW